MTAPQTLYQYDYLLVLDKPAGWIVNQAKTTRGQGTVEEWLRENFSYPLIFLPNLRAGIAHRLDKDTSGVMVLARHVAAETELQRAFANKTIRKTYLALVVGVPFHPDGAAHENTVRARRFARQLHGRFRLPVFEVDERYSTTEAHAQGARDADAAAACIILEQFLRNLP